MKKLYAIILSVLCVFILVGCDSETNPTSLVTQQYNKSIWEYYYEYENVENKYTKILQDEVLGLNDNQNVALTDSQKYLNVITNNKLYKNVLRDCIAVIDVFENNEKKVLLEFEENISQYEIEEKSQGKYDVSYLQIVPINKYMGLSENLNNDIFVELKHNLTISLEKSDTGIYNIKTVTQKIMFSDEIVNSGSFEHTETQTDENGNIVETTYKLTNENRTTPVNYIQTTLYVCETVKNSNNVQISKNEREQKYYYQDNHYYLRDIVKMNNQQKSQQIFRLDNSFSNIAINFNQDTGYLCYDMIYNLSGEVKIFGEMYYQGQNKFLAKEFFNVLQGNPYAISQSFITETNYGETVNTKTKYNTVLYTNIREQKLEDFAVSTSNDSGFVFASISTEDKVNISFYS